MMHGYNHNTDDKAQLINDNLDIVKKLAKNGLLTIPAAENVIRILPPLIIEDNHIEEFCQLMEKTLLLF